MDDRLPSGTAAYLQNHKVEVAAVVSVLLAGMSIVGVVYFFDAHDVWAAKEWEEQPWVSSACAVIGIGVAYRGDCDMETTVEMAVGTFRECPGHLGTTGLGWTRETAKACRLEGNDDYQQSSLDSLREQNWGRTLQGGNALLHPPNFNPPDIRCQNGYLLWLNVVLNMTDSAGTMQLSQRCAYEFGAEDPSIMGTWHDVRSMQAELGGMIGSSENLPCWLLETDDCVVAFHDPAYLTHQEAMEALFSKAMAVICGSLSAVAATVAVYLGCFKSRAHAYSPLPRSSREEEILDERVGAILRSAAAHWNETTPLGSPRAVASNDASADAGDGRFFQAQPSSEALAAQQEGTNGIDPMSNIAAKLLAEADRAV